MKGMVRPFHQMPEFRLCPRLIKESNFGARIQNRSTAEPIIESSILESRFPKIENQTCRKVGRFKVIEYLREVLFYKTIYSFQFEDNLVFNENVGVKTANVFASEFYIDCYFSLCFQSFIHQCNQK